MLDLLGYALFCAVRTAGGWLLAVHMARVYGGERTLLSPMLAPVERGFYRLSGINDETSQSWKTYALSLLASTLPDSCCSMRSCGCRARCR